MHSSHAQSISTRQYDFDRCLAEPLTAAENLSTIQVNIGLTCNLTCHHCHVNSSPQRTEQMNWSTMDSILRIADELGVQTIDITGGAPEMNPHFKRLIQAIRARRLNVMVRTNLTILLEPGYEDFIEFYQDHHVQLIASLPCYLEENVDKQRGEGVYQDSIDVIRRLNAVGYGIESDLPLNLIFNPGGPVLPPEQSALEEDYRHELRDRFQIEFTNLHTITNVPIGRFKTDLRRENQLDPYMDTLQHAFNSDTVPALMCRHQISVGWDGTVYDCDFNLALRMPIEGEPQQNITTLDTDALRNRPIVTGDHCFACTAGCGSSCGGTLI